MIKFKHIIWDWNGTLFDDAKLCWQIINEIIIENGLPGITFEKYLNIFTFPVKKYYEAVGLPVNNGEFERLGKIFIERYEQRKFQADLHKETKNVIEKFSSVNIKQYVLSAYSLDKLEFILEHFGLSKYFEHIAGLDNIYANSKVEIGKELVEKIKADKKEILLIGDTLHDAEVSDELGISSLLVANGHQTKERLLQSNVQVVNSLNEVVEFVLNGN